MRGERAYTRLLTCQLTCSEVKYLVLDNGDKYWIYIGMHCQRIYIFLVQLVLDSDCNNYYCLAPIQPRMQVHYLV